MKELCLMMGCLFLYQVLKAQTWSEWFQQNTTQLQYLQEQIAALQQYNTSQQSGYAVSEAGLVEIGNTESADHSEHEGYFSSFRAPSHAELADPRIRVIDSLCERCSLIANAVEAVGLLRNPETEWVELVESEAKEIDDGILEVSGRLYTLLLDGQLAMTDAERQKAIAELEKDALALYDKAAWILELMTAKPILP